MQIESRSRLGRIYQSDRRPSAYTSVRYLTGILVAAVLPCKRTETSMPAPLSGNRGTPDAS
jgi:hypothetical protein